MKLNLKDFRQAHKLFQSDMAEILDMNQSGISRAELRGYINLTYPQLKTLYAKFGKEDVDSFSYDEKVNMCASNNSNDGDVVQTNEYIGTDDATLQIIRQQAQALTRLTEKQMEQTEKLMALIEKITDKI